MIAVIDYGLGNLRSVSKALEKAGAKTKVTNSPKVISKAEAIVFPGVGAFSKGMENLRKLKILKTITDSIKSGKPFLGLCLGLQLLFTESEEYGNHKGFSIIKGKVKRFMGKVKIPHMGWNQVKFTGQHADLFKGVNKGNYFYFVHSYYVEPEDKSIITTRTDYGIEFASSIQKNNIYGLQFHPEKSGELGQRVLENFIRNVR